MAYKKKSKRAEKSEDGSRDPKKDLLTKARDCYKKATEADQENRRAALEDLRFVNEPGAQWDANMKKERGKRPCFEFNKCRINGKRVINEIRANRPQGKVRAVEGGDKKTAELYEGLCRNIYASSDGDTIIDNAAEYQVDAGMTAWRVVTKYSDDTAFDQDIALEGFKNPFCVYADPNCKDPLKRDAEYWLVTERISNESYETRWPKAERISFDDLEFDDQEEWEDDDTTRICEYWYKEPYDKEIWQVVFPQADGTTKRVTVDSTSDEAAGIAPQQIERKRKVRCHRIKMCILSGDALLEEADWAGSKFPFVMIYGEAKVIDGKFCWWGLHRFAKDAQKNYNLNRTAAAEASHQASKSQYWATMKQAEGLTTQWTEAHQKNFPFQLYNHDPAAPGPPQRMVGPELPVAFLGLAEADAQDIRDVTGLHEASFGEESEEKSGIALARKQHQAQIVTYNFPDNVAKGIRLTWEIMIDLIPNIYDAERELRIIGADGAEDYAKVNQIVLNDQGQAVRVNDLSVGKYDVTVTTGPNFSTLRQEAAEVYGELVAKFPQIMQVAGDLVFKAMDMPYSDELAKRMQALLLPQVQQQISEGKDLPPEAQAAMAQAAQAMQLVQQQSQLVQQAAQEVEQNKAASDTAKANVEKAIANLKTEEARFDAKVAKALADIQARESALQMQAVQLDAKGQQLEGQAQQTEQGSGELSEAKKAVAEIDKMVAQFMRAAAEILAKIKSEAGVTIAMPAKPRKTGIRAKRVNGELVGQVEYEDGAQEIFRAKRDPATGEMFVEPQAAPTGVQ